MRFASEQLLEPDRSSATMRLSQRRPFYRQLACASLRGDHGRVRRAPRSDTKSEADIQKNNDLRGRPGISQVELLGQ
jgi:hypothetical protein